MQQKARCRLAREPQNCVSEIKKCAVGNCISKERARTGKPKWKKARKEMEYGKESVSEKQKQGEREEDESLREGNKKKSCCVGTVKRERE